VEFQIGRADGPTMELAAEAHEDSTRGYRADDAILRRAALRLMDDATPDVGFLRSYHAPPQIWIAHRLKHNYGGTQAFIWATSKD